MYLAGDYVMTQLHPPPFQSTTDSDVVVTPTLEEVINACKMTQNYATKKTQAYTK